MATDSKIKDTDLEIRKKIKSIVEQLKADSKDIGIDNNTFPVDWQRTEKLLFDSYIKATKENSDINLNVANIIKYNKNIFSKVLQFINDIKNNDKYKAFRNVYISAVSGFVISVWYDTIAQFKPEIFQLRFARFIRQFLKQAKYYADLLPIIKDSIYATSFSWLNRAHNEYTNVNKERIVNQIYKIYKEGVKDSQDSEATLNKVYGFFALIRRIEIFFKKYQQVQVNSLASEQYTELRKAIVEGLNSFASININKYQQLFDNLKRAIFDTILKNSNIYDKYDESALTDPDVIKKVNNRKILLDPQGIEQFNLEECHRYFGNDIIEKLYQRVKDKELTSKQADIIISQLRSIVNIRRNLLNLNLTIEENAKLEEFDNNVFLRARQLALNLASTFSNNPILNDITTLKELTDAIKNNTSKLQRYRNTCFNNKYKALNSKNNFITPVTNQSFGEIINVINNQKLDDFLELSHGGFSSLEETLQKLNDVYMKKRDSNSAQAKKKFSPERWHTVIKYLRKMIDDLCSLKSSTQIIKDNIATWEELHPKQRISNLLTSYRTSIGSFINQINELCSTERINDINEAIYI